MKRDVVLGWDDPTQYCASAQHTYFGATIGRVANRITNGTIRVGGRVYHLPLNEKGFDTLHGGWVGYDRRVWSVVHRSDASVTFSRVSWDGEMGFPGRLEINVTHSITETNEWTLRYAARADAETVLSMTNHAYFNLNANLNNTPTVLRHTVAMPTADRFVEVTPPDAQGRGLLPTGKVGEGPCEPALTSHTCRRARAHRAAPRRSHLALDGLLEK